jgi:hypothetical protein
MITFEEIKQKYLNSNRISQFNKVLLILNVSNIVDYKISTLNPNDIRITLKFVYWNPLTWIYLFFMSFIQLSFSIFDGGVNKFIKDAKSELKNGFMEFL